MHVCLTFWAAAASAASFSLCALASGPSGYSFILYSAASRAAFSALALASRAALANCSFSAAFIRSAVAWSITGAACGLLSGDLGTAGADRGIDEGGAPLSTFSAITLVASCSCGVKMAGLVDTVAEGVDVEGILMFCLAKLVTGPLATAAMRPTPRDAAAPNANDDCG